MLSVPHRGHRTGPAERSRTGRGDLVSLVAVAVLLGMGLLNLWTVAGPHAAMRQAAPTVVGLGLLGMLRRGGIRTLPVLGWVSYVGSVLALLAVPVVGTSGFGARRWLSAGGFTFQPSESAKLGVLIVASLVLAGSRRRRYLYALALAAPPVALTALQPDLSTALLLSVLVLLLFLLAGASLSSLSVGVGALLLLAPAVVELLQPYQLARLRAFLTGTGGQAWAVHQAHIALASGGLVHQHAGPTNALLAQYLPDRRTDLALASLVETRGLLTGAAVVLAVLVLVWQLALAGNTTRSRAAALVAAGSAGLLGAECALSLGGTLGLAPLAGVPFPLVGMGGTSTVVHLAMIGVVLGARRDGITHRLWVAPRLGQEWPRLARPTALTMSVVLLGCSGYAWHLRDTDGPLLRAAADQEITRCTPIPAPRGTITDRHGTVLAASATAAGPSGPVPARVYPYGPLLAPILGFVGVATPADVSRAGRLPNGELVGRSGVEKSYDGLLRGVDGRHCHYVDPAGRPVGDAGTVPPTPGQSLHLSLDLDLQRQMYQALTRQIAHSGGDVGSAVALDPRSGQVLAMAGVPSYDNAIFGPPVDAAAVQVQRSMPTAPMLEHATQLAAPPGSVFKLVVAAADMVAGAVPPDKVVSTGSRFRYRGHTFGNWRPLGPQNLTQALAWSNDVYFYKLALALGPDVIHRVGTQLGVGMPTGIDLPGENAGLFADPQSVAAHGGTWEPGATVILGIGQGELVATPLQVARWTTGVATGRMLVPRLGMTADDAAGTVTALPTPPPAMLPFADRLGAVRAGMRAAVRDGTGRLLRKLHVGAGAKTGSAQDPSAPHHRPDSWFTAFAPMTDPALVVTVFIRGGGHGADAAGPVVEQTLSYFLDHEDSVTAVGPAG